MSEFDESPRKYVSPTTEECEARQQEDLQALREITPVWRHFLVGILDWSVDRFDEFVSGHEVRILRSRGDGLSYFYDGWFCYIREFLIGEDLRLRADKVKNRRRYSLEDLLAKAVHGRSYQALRSEPYDWNAARSRYWRTRQRLERWLESNEIPESESFLQRNVHNNLALAIRKELNRHFRRYGNLPGGLRIWRIEPGGVVYRDPWMSAMEENPGFGFLRLVFHDSENCFAFEMGWCRVGRPFPKRVNLPFENGLETDGERFRVPIDLEEEDEGWRWIGDPEMGISLLNLGLKDIPHETAGRIPEMVVEAVEYTTDLFYRRYLRRIMETFLAVNRARRKVLTTGILSDAEGTPWGRVTSRNNRYEFEKLEMPDEAERFLSAVNDMFASGDLSNYEEVMARRGAPDLWIRWEGVKEPVRVWNVDLMGETIQFAMNLPPR